MLRIKNLIYYYPNTDTTYGYTLELKPKEIVAILGASGSGKSTFFDLIAGFLSPLSGTISLDSNDFTAQRIEKRPLSILFQNNNLFEHLSVEKNIRLGVSKTLKAKEDEAKRVQEILGEVGLEGFGARIASELSGGQQQRVALARVLLRREPILLLDEPFAGLDEKTRIEMLSLVAKITHAHDLHTVMITHDVDDAKRIATDIYIMQNNSLKKQ